MRVLARDAGGTRINLGIGTAVAVGIVAAWYRDCMGVLGRETLVEELIERKKP